MDKKKHTYVVKRTVIEYYQVMAVSKAEACIEAGRKGDPFKIETKTESAKKWVI
jgi:hypothetical protein